MARPKKQTVDYYPHSSRQGKTMFILKSKFGNNGYAFFHQLCEVLCHTEGHVIDYGNPSDKEYLLAYCGVDEDSATEMLNTLSTLGKIDIELWGEKVIWYQDLVDSVKDAYSKRINQLPQKPSFRSNKSIQQEFPTTETPSNEVSNDGSTESKLKESKLKESKYIVEIIDYLNEKNKSDFKTNTNKTKSLINARLKEGFTVDDFKSVIDVKTDEWKNDSHYKKYLQPSTLFGGNFEGYLNQAKISKPKAPQTTQDFLRGIAKSGG